MRVGILGSGDVAQTLGSGLMAIGHTVMFGTRDPDKLREWADKHSGAMVGSFADAATHGEILVLAVKGAHAIAALRLAGAANLSGKPVMDATNPIADAPPIDGVLQYFTTMNDSLMEQLQREFADANFVKAFSSVGAMLMVNPVMPGGPPTMFICGNNESAKATVGGIVTSFGWEVMDLGTAVAARAIEPLCMLWCIPGMRTGQWVRAFKMLHPA
jgi:8-hydroxy-5-deazaflavin:NADPH oxidoreductase